MIRSLIIEDELKGRKTLTNYLGKFCPEVEIIGEAANVSQGIEMIITLQPDLIFLDISLPDGNGFDILQKVKHLDFELIFTTAYDQYALEAIKKSRCCDYLIKPLSIKDLQIAVSKAKSNLIKKNELLSLKKLDNNPQNITIPTLERYEVIAVKDIIYCKANGAWTTLFLRGGKSIVSSKNLGTFEKILTHSNFYRTHRSYLINLSEVKAYIKKRSGKAIMSNGDEIEISEANKIDFIKRLNVVK